MGSDGKLNFQTKHVQAKKTGVNINQLISHEKFLDNIFVSV